MSTNGGGSPQPWCHNNGSNTKNDEGNDRIANASHGQSSHRHQSHHHHHHERLHERDRDKNHETVCNLLSMLTLGMDQQSEASSNPGGSSNSSNVDHNRMLLLNLTNSPESCIGLRRAGCIPLLIEILYPPSSPPLGMRPPEIIKTRAVRALKNIVQYNPDEKLKRKELRVFKLLEGIRAFSEAVRSALQTLGKDAVKQITAGATSTSDENSTALCTVGSIQVASSVQQHPTANMTTLMKLSFDEEHRNIMCLLGAIHALAELIVCDHLLHGNTAPEMKDECLLIRRYSGMTLTNLTFGDGTNKALLCGMKEFMGAFVAQLECDNEDVCQVTASVLRNLSWHADSTSRASLRESNAVPKLTLAAIKSTKESTLKATLSALWNLSAHSIPNKTAICTASPESLPFLISLLRPNNPLMKTLKTPMIIIENAGGILRNISTEIKSSPELRKVLRENRCYEILLDHLKSCSLSVVSNACGTLWNLSGGVGCEEDQRKLLDLNAVPMLKNLIYSKHERISQGASAALRNLLSSRFAKEHMLQLDTRMTAHIYSPNAGANSDRVNCPDPSQESPGSDGDFEFEYGGGNVHHPHASYQQQPQQIVHHPPMVHQEPPVAHQHSSAAAASIFQRMHAPPAHSVTPVPPPHYHVAPPNFAHPASYVMNRPTSINYSIEPEPLDLTLTSAKSSPIHVISAAEFGGITGHHGHLHHSHPHHRKPKSAQFSHNTHYQQQQSSNSQKPFFNSPAMLHHPTNSSASQANSPMRFTYPGAKFNRSCPEILSRLNSAGHPQMAQMSNFVAEPKPLDFSSNTSPTPSGTSSLRGAGEAAGSHNDSASGGDTTFNYSLQFTEEDEDDRGNSNGNGESASKSEDTLKTYCYEGTPHNFSISNSCQDLVHEIEMEKVATSSATEEKAVTSSQANKAAKLQPIDETPKAYYVENTPAVFSRTSSLSSINSSGGLNAGENKAEPIDNECPAGLSEGKKVESFGDDCQGAAFGDHMQQQLHPQKRRSGPQHGTFTPARVTFSAEETPLMFSRCSSVASLDSLDVGVVGGNGGGNGLASHNDDDLSDFSRRASEVVSPTESELPDSPHDIVPPQRVYEQPSHQSKEEKQDGEDDVKVFSMEEKSGLNSCRSLSPLMIDGEELPVLSKRKMLESEQSHGQTKGRNSVLAERTVQSEEGRTPLDLGVASSGSKHQDGPAKKKTNAFPDDEVKVFALEGTPFYGVSNATSLSDLTMDLDNEEPPKSGEKKKQVPVNAGVCVTEGESCSKPTTSAAATEVDLKTDEPIYSDVQLLQKCIRIGKSIGIPKSKSEYKIMTHSESMEQMSIVSNISGSSTSLTKPGTSGATKKKPLVESKSHQDFDDPDLAALIMKGRNRPKEKERSSSKNSKPTKNVDKDNSSKSSNAKFSSESEASKLIDEGNRIDDCKSLKESVRIEVKEVDEKNPPDSESKSNEPSDSSEQGQTSKEESGENNIAPEQKDVSKTELKLTNLNIDPSQISTTSLGSEWNDETPTFSSPIPSMSISTAFKIVGGGGTDDSSCSKSAPPLPPKINKAITASMQSSMLTMSINNELLDNIDPPSTFSNLVSSSDCILMGSPPMNPKMQGSCSDKLSRKWKAINEAANTSSIHSNLSGQRPPLDLDLENSMISVASIKSEIYELSSTASYTNDIFQSAVEDIASPSVERVPGIDTSIGGNTYTIFPPENVVGENGNKSNDVVSEGGNTVVSDDFTDAEEIEDYETAPADDHIDHLVQAEKHDQAEKEKSDPGKPEVVDNPKTSDDKEEDVSNVTKDTASPVAQISAVSRSPQQPTPPPKPLMEVHPLETGNKYGTFKVNKSPLSPKSSPKQKRRDDPERYKTRTIAALQAGRALMTQQHSTTTSDNNGNPLDDDTRFATFRVGGPKIVKPAQNVNTPSVKSSQSNSPESTPGNSPKGIRGRRKPLYSSLPPSAIAAKKKVAPPVPPKPVRNSSPVRPPSAGSGGVYVRPTRTSELRIAANSRDNSPGRGGASSRTSSNSSLNLIQSNPSRESTPSRPKVAPKPPVRTSASVSSTSGAIKPFSGSTYNVLIKTSNSSFGFGQQKVGDGSVAQNMKGYSTLPKSSKLGGEFAGMYMPGSVPGSQNGESKESIPGSEKSQGKMGKLSNLFKRMDFHRNSKEVSMDSHSFQCGDNNKQNEASGGYVPPAEKKPSKFSNFFGRKKDKGQPKQPFLDGSVVGDMSVGSGNTASIRGTSGIWVRRDGENKALVAPFNYVPPPGHTVNPSHQQQVKETTNYPLSSAASSSAANNNSGNANTTISRVNSENVQTSATSAAAGSAKITTV